NNLESSKELIPKIQSSIEEMYDTLEKEVESRDYLESQLPIFKESLDNFEEKLTETQDEVAVLKEAYHFAAEDLDKFENIEKNHLITQQENKSEGLSNLAIQLDDSLNKLAQVESDHKAFSEHIKMLRKDEIEARNQLESLNQEIKAASRRLKMNNLPGIPNFIWEKLNEAKVANEKVIDELSKTP